MTMQGTTNTQHATPLIQRIWKDYLIPSLGFTTVMLHSPRGWRAEISQWGTFVASGLHSTEAAAQEEATQLANRKWPPATD